MTWDSRQSTGQPEIDQSILTGVPTIEKGYRDLVSLIDHLSRNPDASPDPEVFFDVLSQLGLRLRLHFDAEESILWSCDMPYKEVIEHVQTHHKILDQYVRLNFDLMEGRLISRPEALLMIKHWIIDHLIQYDFRIRKYLLCSPL